MTLELDTAGPGTTTSTPVGFTSMASASTKFTCKVNGTSVYVYSSNAGSDTTPTPLQSFGAKAATANTLWSANNQTIEFSYFTYGTDQTASVEITRLAGAITSYNIYPKSLGLTASLNAGLLTITMPVRGKIYVELNNDRTNTLGIFAQPRKASVPTGAVTYNGSQSSIADGATLRFPAGVWNIGQNFPVGNGATAYLDTGAYVVGSFTDVAKNGSLLTGPGILSGEAIDPMTMVQPVTKNATSGTTTSVTAAASSFVNANWNGGTITFLGNVTGALAGVTRPITTNTTTTINWTSALGATPQVGDTFTVNLSFNQQCNFTLVNGYSAGSNAAYQTFGKYITGITMIRPPFYTTLWSGQWCSDVKIIGPWFYNTDGWVPNPDATAALLFPSAVNALFQCGFIYIGDDCSHLSSYINGQIDQTLIVGGAADNVLLSYTNDVPAYVRYLTNNCLIANQSISNASNGSLLGAVILSMVDNSGGSPSGYGYQGLRITNCTLEGPCAVPPHKYVCASYPFGGGGTGLGQISDIIVNGFAIEQTPTKLSLLYGVSTTYCPHDIQFTSYTVAGTRVDEVNAQVYFSLNQYTRNIVFDAAVGSKRGQGQGQNSPARLTDSWTPAFGNPKVGLAGMMSAHAEMAPLATAPKTGQVMPVHAAQVHNIDPADVSSNRSW